MALNIRNAEAEKLAEQLARLTGETKTEAITQALRDRLARLRRERAHRRLADELDEIALRCSQLPVLDPRTSDEILGYVTRTGCHASPARKSVSSEIFGKFYWTYIEFMDMLASDFVLRRIVDENQNRAADLRSTALDGNSRRGCWGAYYQFTGNGCS
jgi:antitoxin VapB